MNLRTPVLLVFAALLAGCGSSSSEDPTRPRAARIVRFYEYVDRAGSVRVPAPGDSFDAYRLDGGVPERLALTEVEPGTWETSVLQPEESLYLATGSSGSGWEVFETRLRKIDLSEALPGRPGVPTADAGTVLNLHWSGSDPQGQAWPEVYAPDVGLEEVAATSESDHWDGGTSAVRWSDLQPPTPLLRKGDELWVIQHAGANLVSDAGTSQSTTWIEAAFHTDQVELADGASTDLDVALTPVPATTVSFSFDEEAFAAAALRADPGLKSPYRYVSWIARRGDVGSGASLAELQPAPVSGSMQVRNPYPPDWPAYMGSSVLFFSDRTRPHLMFADFREVAADEGMIAPGVDAPLNVRLESVPTVDGMRVPVVAWDPVTPAPSYYRVSVTGGVSGRWVTTSTRLALVPSQLLVSWDEPLNVSVSAVRRPGWQEEQPHLTNRGPYSSAELSKQALRFP